MTLLNRIVAAACAASALVLAAAPAQAGPRHGGPYGAYGRHGGSWVGHGYWGGPGRFWGGFGLGIGVGAVGLQWNQWGASWPADYVYVTPPAVYIDATPRPVPLTVAPAPVARPAPEPVVYPRDNQSAEQTEIDRRECNRWATTQPSAMADASVFQRATLACLEGRGYTVR